MCRTAWVLQIKIRRQCLQLKESHMIWLRIIYDLEVRKNEVSAGGSKMFGIRQKLHLF